MMLRAGEAEQRRYRRLDNPRQALRTGLLSASSKSSPRPNAVYVVVNTKHALPGNPSIRHPCLLVDEEMLAGRLADSAGLTAAANLIDRCFVLDVGITDWTSHLRRAALSETAARRVVPRCRARNDAAWRAPCCCCLGLAYTGDQKTNPPSVTRQQKHGIKEISSTNRIHRTNEA